jgi:hypothetical protein
MTTKDQNTERQTLISEIGDELERRLRRWGMIDHEPQSLEERQRLALVSLQMQARLALGLLHGYPVTPAAWSMADYASAQRVAINLGGVLEAFEREFKL